MIKLLELKKKKEYKFKDTAKIILKGDFFAATVFDKNTVVVIDGILFEDTTDNYTLVGDIPNFVLNFGHLKLQKFVEYYKRATELGFEFKSDIIGTLSQEDTTSLDNNWFDEFLENTKKTIVFLPSRYHKDIPEKDTTITTDNVVATCSNCYQVVFVDFTKPTNSRFLVEGIEALGSLKPLSKDEIKRIELKKVAKEWSKDIDKRVKSLLEDEIKLTKTLEKLKIEILQTQKNYLNNKREQYITATLASQDGEEILKRLGEVSELPFVKDTEYKGTNLIVHLKDFSEVFPWNGHKFKIPFRNARIIMSPEKVNILHDDPVVIRGTTYYHMHINGPDKEGDAQSCCFGDHSHRVYTALGLRKFKEIVFLSKMLLGTYSVDGAHVGINDYLVARKLAEIVDDKIVPLDKVDEIEAVTI